MQTIRKLHLEVIQQLLYHPTNHAYVVMILVQSRCLHLSSSSRDEEPLVNAWVNWCRRKVLVLRKRRKLLRSDTAWGLLDSEVGTGGC